jgi:hypothetical protein
VAQELATTSHPHMLQQPPLESNRLQLPSCGAVENATPTWRKKNRKTLRRTKQKSTALTTKIKNKKLKQNKKEKKLKF